MITVMIIYLLMLAVAVVVVWVTALVYRFGRVRMQRLEEVLSRRYMRVVTTLILSNEGLPTHFPMMERRGAHEVLSRVLATVASSLYGPDVVAVGRMARDNGVDEWLLRRAHRTRGLKRAYYMSLLAALPLAPEMVTQVARYADDGCRFVRFYALLIRIGHDSSSALRELAEYRESLNGFELAEIVAMLRRGMLPVACEPLLVSPSRNLRVVGLNIAREFGIEQVRPLLLEMAASDADEDVAQDALYALVAMHSSLASREIATGVRNMLSTERRSLCRRLAYEGYSATALERLFGRSEGRYAQRLVATYKRRIVCIPQL